MSVPARGAPWWTLAALLLLLTVVAAPVLTYPLGRDQGEFATIGRGILDGKLPYVDLWNPKPPAVFYLYAGAMALLGRTVPALRALDLVAVPLAGLALGWVAWRLFGRRAALWSAVLFPVFYITETFWTLTQNDGLALAPMAAAFACALRAADGGRRAAWWALAAGLLCGWTVWFKYPFALIVPAVALSYAIARRRGGRARDSRVVAAFVLGGAAVVLGGAAYLGSRGALDDLIESARVTSLYAALGANADDLGAAFANYAGYRWAQWGLLVVLALAWLPLRARRAGESAGWWIVLLWLAAAAGILVVQAKFYDYHWLPMLPPLVLLAAGALDALLAWLERRFPPARVAGWVVGVALAALLARGVWGTALPYLTGQEDELAYAARFQAGEFVADESLRVAAYLRERVAPGDSLFIWGFRPEVYYLSRLNPAIRFIFQFPLVGDWYPAAWREEAVEILWAAMPPYVLVLQADYMPWVTGRHEDSNTLLQEYTPLNNWLIANYDRDTQIGNFFVWRRKPQSP